MRVAYAVLYLCLPSLCMSGVVLLGGMHHTAPHRAQSALPCPCPCAYPTWLHCLLHLTYYAHSRPPAPRAGKLLLLELGDREVDVSPGFRLFLTSRLANPTFSPETCARVTVIDFTVTQLGLEDQLLARLVQKERAELEDRRRRLIEEVRWVGLEGAYSLGYALWYALYCGA